MTYNIKFTDINKPNLVVADNDINNSATDISIFGRTKLEYGRDMNANLLHILENFACPENLSVPGTPDLTGDIELGTNIVTGIGETNKKLLETPTVGQLWFNKTQSVMFSWNGVKWVPMSMKGDIAVNWGTVCDGERIPKPVSSSGYVYPYSECSWIVSPAYTDAAFEYVLCSTNLSADVTMRYGNVGGGYRIGFASFMIVGIRGNTNIGTIFPPMSPPAPSPTPLPLTATPTPTATATVTPTVTPTITVTPTVTPSFGASPTPTATITVTPTPTAAVTPTVTPTPSALIYGITAFGDLENEIYNFSGVTNLGIVINGKTGVPLNTVPPHEEDTSMTVRLETAYFDTASDFWIAPSPASIIGSEPSYFGTDFWVWVDVTSQTNSTYRTGSAATNQWIQIGEGVFFIADTKNISTSGGPLNATSARFNGNVYMKQSTTMPVASPLIGDLVGTFSTYVSANDIP